MFDITKVNWKKVGIFASGVLFENSWNQSASASKDAKNVYTNCTAAAVLRAKDCVMKTATNIQENAEDIYAEAKNINEERACCKWKNFLMQIQQQRLKKLKIQKFNEVTE